MAKHNFNEIDANWELMTPMESSLWGTTLALHADDADGGLVAADKALEKLRHLTERRSQRRDPEEEAALSNVYLTFEEFAPWYTVEHRIRYCRSPSYKPPTPDEVDVAYNHYLLSRDCFF